jgi:hypothetical protein
MNKTLNVFVVDANGSAIPGARVSISSGGEIVGSATTKGTRNLPVGLQLDDVYNEIEVTVEYKTLKKGPFNVDLATRNFEVVFPEVSLPRHTGPAKWEKIAIFVFGVAFVAVLLSIAVLVPNPSNFSIFVFRIVLALAAAGVAALIPGFFDFESKTILYTARAGGALGVFLLVYLVNPPALIHVEDSVPIPGDAAWLIGGRLRLDRSTGQHVKENDGVVWADGPLFQILNNSATRREIPKSGDRIKLLKKRLLYIVDFKTAGIAKTHVAPPDKGVLDNTDETGVWLPAGTVLDVRRVEQGFYLGKDVSFLWLRVGYPDQ